MTKHDNSNPVELLGTLHVVDDDEPYTLTASDIRELKWLASQSKISRILLPWVIAFASSLSGLIVFMGADHLIKLIQWFKS